MTTASPIARSRYGRSAVLTVAALDISRDRTPAIDDRAGTRSAFQFAMQQRFIDQVERLTGRVVLSFISNQHVGPDIEIEIFMLASPTRRRRAETEHVRMLKTSNWLPLRRQPTAGSAAAASGRL
jgi:hypothetical protein